MIPVRNPRETEVSNGRTSDEKFRKTEHLLKTRDFKLVYNKGAAVKDGAFVLYRLANNLKHSRIGFSIGSKNVRLANSRNRLKRLFREVYRRNKHKIKSGYDLVLIVRRDRSKELNYLTAEKVFITLTKNILK